MVGLGEEQCEFGTKSSSNEVRQAGVGFTQGHTHVAGDLKGVSTHRQSDGQYAGEAGGAVGNILKIKSLHERR